MRKCIIALVMTVILGLIFSVKIESSLISTMFTVAGVIFSVGMSLVVSLSTQNIHHKQAKKEVNDKLNAILYGYVLSFLLMALYFAVTMLFKEKESEYFKELEITLFQRGWKFNYPFTLLLYIGYCMVYYVFNMWATRKRHYEIEKLIDKENE